MLFTKNNDAAASQKSLGILLSTVET